MFTKNIVATKTCGSLFDDLRLVLSFSAYSAVISTNTSILSRKYWLASSIDSGSSLNAITSALQSLLFQTINLKLNTWNCRLIDNVPLFICSYTLEGWFKTRNKDFYIEIASVFLQMSVPIHYSLDNVNRKWCEA